MQKLTKNNSTASISRMPLVLITTLSLAGCVTLGSGADRVRFVDTSCEAFQPITYSSRDTERTRDEVRAFNRAFDAICPGKEVLPQ